MGRCECDADDLRCAVWVVDECKCNDDGAGCRV